MNFEKYIECAEKYREECVAKKFKKEKQYDFTTLRHHIAAFAFYFRENNLPDITKDVRIKETKRGLNRIMNGNANPNRKNPFIPEFFLQMLKK